MRKNSRATLGAQVADTFYSLVYGHVKQIHCKLSVSQALLLLGKGQGRGELVSELQTRTAGVPDSTLGCRTGGGGLELLGDFPVTWEKGVLS